jgi:tripartite-type tricarboxylate transporter receptor subunit TctC
MIRPRPLALLFGALCALTLAAFSTPLLAQSRPVALVIGQNDYLKLGKLENAVNDAKLMTTVLQSRGFEVVSLANASAAQMRQGLADFQSMLARRRRGIVYYAGHGVQLGDENILVPVDLGEVSAARLTQLGLTLRQLVTTLAPAQPEALAIILDACRDNPLAAAQIQKKGLGEAGIDIPSGFFVIYGASAGQTALDSEDTRANGLFTARFTRWLADPSLSLRQVMRRTRVDVMETARQLHHQQLPSVYDTLPRDSRFYAQAAPQAPARLHPPAGPVRMIVPTAAGGPTDLVARALVKRLQAQVSQPITVENIIDIPGLKVADLVGEASRDGRTLLFSPYHSSLARLRRGDQRLSGIGLVTETPVMLFAHGSAGMRNLQQMLQKQRATGKALDIGVSGPGSAGEFCVNELRRVWGESIFNVVSFRGVAPSLVALMGGRLDLICEPVSSFAPQVASGQVVPLANLQEDAAAKDSVTTAQAQGYAIVVPNWTALFAPAGTDAAMVAYWSNALQRVLVDPTFQAELRGFSAGPVTPDKGVPLEVELSLKVGLEVAR